MLIVYWVATAVLVVLIAAWILLALVGLLAVRRGSA
jgi:hypothetical protein